MHSSPGLPWQQQRDVRRRRQCGYSNAVAALAVTRLGGQPSMPTALEVEDLLAGRSVATQVR